MDLTRTALEKKQGTNDNAMSGTKMTNKDAKMKETDNYKGKKTVKMTLSFSYS